MPSPEKFRESLNVFDVNKEITDLILDGYENLIDRSPKAKKAAFFKRALDIMDELLPPEKVHDIMEWNACCKSGAREKNSKEFARIKNGIKLEEKLSKIAQAPYMNMGVPVLEQNGTLLINAVSYMYDGIYACGCPTFSRLKREYPVSKSYCFCCSGHFKYHYEIMLGVKLELLAVVSSPLDSNGAMPCVFRFKIIE